MQKKRVKEENRYMFTLDEKRTMLKRTDGKCARCGKELHVGNKDCTVEHIIPLSKGGKNEPTNLICMCKSCNLEKGNDIVEPSWYKYLNESEVEVIERLFLRYLKDYCHISSTNLLPVDQYSVTIHFNARTGDLYYDSGTRVIDVAKQIVWKKARLRDDLDKIVEAYKRFNKKNNVEYDGVRSRVIYLIKNGCVYYVEDSHGEVKLVVPFALATTGMGVDVKKFIYGSAKANKQIPCVFFIDPINCTSKRVYQRAMMFFFQYVIGSIMSALDTNMLRTLGIGIRTNNLESELRFCFDDDVLDIEDDIIFWDTFTCRERKVFDKQALTPKELEDYVKKTTSKIKELELEVKDVNIVMKEV